MDRIRYSRWEDEVEARIRKDEKYLRRIEEARANYPEAGWYRQQIGEAGRAIEERSERLRAEVRNLRDDFFDPSND